MATSDNDLNYLLEQSTVRDTATTTVLIASRDNFIRQLFDGSLWPVSILLYTNTTTFTNATYYWEYSTNVLANVWNEIAGATSSTYTLTNSLFNTYLGIYRSVTFRVTASQLGYISSSASFTVSLINEAEDVVYISVDNPYPTVNTDTAGTPTGYGGTGITISVYKNGEIVPYSETSAGYFRVGTPTMSPTNGVTLGTKTSTTNTVTYGNITNMLSFDRVTVTYPIIIKNEAGNDRPAVYFSQVFSKNKQGLDSYRTAYSKTTQSSLNTTPATISTSGLTSLPPAFSWGSTGAWTDNATVLVAGEKLYKSDGLYTLSTNTTVWNLPYKIADSPAELDDISPNTGDLVINKSITSNSNTFVSNTITGSGVALNSDGSFALGKTSSNIRFVSTAVVVKGCSFENNTIDSGVY